MKILTTIVSTVWDMISFFFNQSIQAWDEGNHVMSIIIFIVSLFLCVVILFIAFIIGYAIFSGLIRFLYKKITGKETEKEGCLSSLTSAGGSTSSDFSDLTDPLNPIGLISPISPIGILNPDNIFNQTNNDICNSITTSTDFSCSDSGL